MLNDATTKQVNVTWKWLAISAISVVGWFAITDRSQFEQRISTLEENYRQVHDQILKLPTRDDIRDIIQAEELRGDKNAKER